ncbi:MAG: anthranilate synthase component I [uncultured bacterium]|nr:MAG: anthranilate synthase component I [uncultured bacterium]
MISFQLHEARQPLATALSPSTIFSLVRSRTTPEFIFESAEISPIYGRFSLIGLDPALKIQGKNDFFSIESLNERGDIFLNTLSEKDFSHCTTFNKTPHSIHGTVPKGPLAGEESTRSKRPSILLVIQTLLAKFHHTTTTLCGLYGAFSYDAVRLVEDLPEHLPDSDVNDFTFFLFDTFIHFDLIKETTKLIAYRTTPKEAAAALENLQEKLDATSNDIPLESFSITQPSFTYSQEEYEQLVELARDYTRQGELFEIVFSNTLKAHFDGDPFALYQAYRELNPSPYLFYFDLVNEQLVGASPEMMVRLENGKVHLRPISGTAPRGRDVIEDHDNMIQLLQDEKERAELNMLIDLGRNDLARVCEPGIELKDYRFVEKYSRVMHTVAHLTGRLKKGFSALDALFACANAGTLTGAPKVRAMELIEQHEKERRGYYGGTIGYLTFSGEMDTAILIRTAHIQNGSLRFQVGATLLYDSDPTREYEETLHKANAFLTLIS